MFKKHQTRKSSNPIFVLFRLILSLVMLVILLVGVYSAYKHFSGYDPLKLDPQAVARELLNVKTPQELLGFFSSQVNEKVLPAGRQVLGQNLQNIPVKTETTSSNYQFKFLLIADSHNDSSNLQRAILQAKQANPDLAFIIGLGDYSDVGTTGELKTVKTEFDLAGLRYFLVAGDHDLWDSRNRNLPPDTNFKQIFGPLYQSFTFNNFKFLLLDNSDNYIGIDEKQKNWIAQELEKARNEELAGIFVFIHEPLYHPSSDHYMGKLEKSLKSQAEGLIYQLKESEVKKVFSGDIHYFSQYEEPVTKISMITVGAITIERNPQAPRYAVVSVFEDGSTKVEDIAIK